MATFGTLETLRNAYLAFIKPSTSDLFASIIRIRQLLLATCCNYDPDQQP